MHRIASQVRSGAPVAGGAAAKKGRREDDEGDRRRRNVSGAAELAAVSSDGLLSYADFTATPEEIVERQHVKTATQLAKQQAAARQPTPAAASPRERARPRSAGRFPAGRGAAAAQQLRPQTAASVVPPAARPVSASPRSPASPAGPAQRDGQADPIVDDAGLGSTPFHRRVWYTAATSRHLRLIHPPEFVVLRAPDGPPERVGGVYRLMGTPAPIVYNGQPVWIRSNDPACHYILYSKPSEAGDVWAVGDVPDTPPFRPPKETLVEAKKKASLNVSAGIKLEATRVSDSFPGGPAAERGVRSGWRLTRVGPFNVASAEDVAAAFSRQGEMMTLVFREDLTPGQPYRHYVESAKPHGGVAPHVLPQEMTKDVGGKAKKDRGRKKAPEEPQKPYSWKQRRMVPVAGEGGEEWAWEWGPDPQITVQAAEDDRKTRRLRFGARISSRLSTCLSIVHRALLSETRESYRSMWEFKEREDDASWRVSLDDYSRALTSLGVGEDAALRRREFCALSRSMSDSPAPIPYRDLMTSLERLLHNDQAIQSAFCRFASLGGPLWEAGGRYELTRPPAGGALRRAAAGGDWRFDAVEHIHKEKLLEMRGPRLSGVLRAALRGEPSTNRLRPEPLPVTAPMVKSLLDMFGSFREEENTDFMDRADGRKKKKKKKKKGGGLPPHQLHYRMAGSKLQGQHAYHRNRHINYPRFRDHLLKDPEMVRSFLPLFLQLVVRDPALIGLGEVRD